MTIQQKLENIIADANLHGRFLQHLSFLEKCGHQKLLRLKHHKNIKDKDFLQHLAEEARHAAHLKRLSLSLTNEKEQIGVQTRNYLTKLEIYILKEFRHHKIIHPKACYILLTYIIEVRAEKLYESYEELISKNEMGLSVRCILEDEVNHLELMKKEITNIDIPERFLNSCFEYEGKLFSDFIEQF